MKKSIIVSLLFLIIVCSVYSLGAGMFYPRKMFSFLVLNTNYDWGSADECLNNANDKTLEINILFRRTGNRFKYEFYPEFLTKKNYSRLYIKEIAYLYENKELIVLSNAEFSLSNAICDIENYDKGWITNGTYYWMNGWTAEPENWKDKSKLWPRTNFEKIFAGKKVGDVFPFSVRVVYYFDDEMEKTVIQKFRVTTLKGEYISPFAGL